MLLLCFAFTPDVLPFLPLVAGHGKAAWCPQVDVAAWLQFWFFTIGCWYGVISFVILLIRALLRGPSRPGCCLNCGYDLRATPDRCPECGTVVKPT